MDKHTPGPWTYAEEFGGGADLPCITTVGRCCEFVIGIKSDTPGGNYRNGDPSGDPEADARLMAAAPELLDAARAFVAPFEGVDMGEGSAVSLARAAIAKAVLQPEIARWDEHIRDQREASKAQQAMPIIKDAGVLLALVIAPLIFIWTLP